MKALFLLLFIATTASASDKECEKNCRYQFDECKTKVFDWAQDKYIEIEGLSYYSINVEIDDRYNEVRKEEKARKKACKDKNKECKLTCE